ncbi:MAG: sodium:solute symporter family protein [Ignavibacteriaceae bacterium]|nr:sodium:solute symporter family protein [Ignavibacteriaceae bacterium]
MISLSDLDISIILLFFGILFFIGFYFSRKKNDEAVDYLLGGRNLGLFLFILTNVSTWYGGVLGIAEFTYNYGLASWFTQGLPYYLFAFLFALFFAKKIRAASLFTLPEKLKETYGKKVGLLSALVVFILVSPAPYLLMLASIFTMLFKTNLLTGLVIALFLIIPYMLKGGYRADIYTDAFQFFVMFGGFILFFYFCWNSIGNFNFLTNNLPATHLQLTGGASPIFILVWFLIALWTFADPGFHQRCNAAKSGEVAVKGILISIAFWALFDFLTTATGLYARAIFPNLKNPSISFFLLADKILAPGVKGIFYAGVFATILSTFNSLMFLSATTIGNDFISQLSQNKSTKVISNTKFGLILTGLVAGLLAYFIPSVVQLWYTIGSIAIPGIIFLVVGSYYSSFKIENKFAAAEIVFASGFSLLWFFVKKFISTESLWFQVEPMIVGLTTALVIHLLGMAKIKKSPK